VVVPRAPAYSAPEVAALCPALSRLFSLVPSGEIPMGFLRGRSWIPGRDDGTDPSRFYPSRERLFRDLYHSARSPYEGLEVSEERLRLFDMYPSNAFQNARALRDRVLREFRGEVPRLIVEVGSFIGSGGLARRGRGDSLVLCVDTWQGDLSMRLLDVYRDAVRVTNGFPTLGSVFMERMLYSGLQDTVFPLPMPGVAAARLLYLLGYRVDVIYVDSAHERGETAAELQLFYALLRPGGLLMGDDAGGFPAVRSDLELFAGCHNLTFEVFLGEQWIVRKPG